MTLIESKPSRIAQNSNRHPLLALVASAILLSLVILPVARAQAPLSPRLDLPALDELAQSVQVTRDVRETWELLEDAPAPLRDLAGSNVELADALAADVADTQELSQLLHQRQAELEELRHTLNRITQILAIDDLPAAYSDQLRIERQRLTWIRPMESALRSRKSQAALKRIRQIETAQSLQDLRLHEHHLENRIHQSVSLSEEDSAILGVLLETRRTLLEDRQRTLDEYDRMRMRLDQTEAFMLRDGRTLRQLLDEQLIWTRNLPGIDAAWLQEQQLNASLLVTERSRYWGTSQNAVDFLGRQKYQIIPGLFLLAFLTRFLPRIRRRMDALAQRTNRLLTDRFTYTTDFHGIKVP